MKYTSHAPLVFRIIRRDVTINENRFNRLMLYIERGLDSYLRQLTRMLENSDGPPQRGSIPILFLEDGRWSCRFINRSIYRCWLTAVRSRHIAARKGYSPTPSGGTGELWRSQTSKIVEDILYDNHGYKRPYDWARIAAHPFSGKYCRLSPLINKLLL